MNLLEVITLESSAENFISDQLSYFRENSGFNVHLICSPSDNLEAYARLQRAHFKAVQIERTISIKQDFKAFKEIYYYIKENEIDVVIAHSFPKAFLLSTLAAKLLGVKVIVEVSHGAVYETLPFIKKHIILFGERILSSMTTKVVCVSPSVIKSRLRYKLNPRNKMTLLSKGTSNGIDAINKFNPRKITTDIINSLRERYRINSYDFIIGFCGRLVRDKGISELIGGIKLLCNRYPEKSIKLLIIGEPEVRDALPQDTIDYIKTSERIVFTGRIPYSDIQQYYMLMDVFILPSYREGFPTVVLEASAMERPVITTRKTGCIDSIVEGETGLFCDISADSIANAIEPFFDNNYANQIGRNGRKWVVENFEHTIVREAMLNLIKELTNK